MKPYSVVYIDRALSELILTQNRLIVSVAV